MLKMEYRIINKGFIIDESLWEVVIGAVNRDGEFIANKRLFNSKSFSDCVFFMKSHESGVVILHNNTKFIDDDYEFSRVINGSSFKNPPNVNMSDNQKGLNDELINVIKNIFR